MSLILTNIHRKSGKAYIDSKRTVGKYYINCLYFKQAGARSEKRISHCYLNQADAEVDLTLFEHAIETDGAKNWKPDGEYYRPQFDRLRSGVKRSLDEPTSSSLNASESCLFNSINKKLNLK